MTTVLRGCVGAITTATIVRQLQDHGVRVVGMDSDPLSVGFHLCDASYIVPAPDSPEYIDSIRDICIKEKVDAILPSAEEEILVLSSHRSFFDALGVKLFCPSYESCMVCANKYQTYYYLTSSSIPTPARYIWNFAKFPCIVKPKMGRGGKGVFVVEDKAELDMRLQREPDLLVQEYVEGERWGIDVLADWDSTVLSMVSRKKYLMQTGVMTKGITIRDDEAIQCAHQIVSDLKLVGPIVMEYIRDKEGPKFIDINTRFGGGGAAISIQADPNIIPNLIRMIEGKPTIPSEGFTEGITMLRHMTEVFYREEICTSYPFTSQRASPNQCSCPVTAR